MMSLKSCSGMLLLGLLTIIPTTLAQTFTNCNPLNKTDCPTDVGLGVSNYSIDFVDAVPATSVWNTTAGTVTFGDSGAEFTIAEKGDSPTIQTNWYIFFGVIEVWVKAATGTGVVSSVVMESDDLDEIDWEWLGGNTTSVETNYFGKGDTSTYDRAIYYDVDDAMSDFHNYTVDWNSERIEWIIDNTVVRTLKYDAAENGTRFPQTPMNLRLGIWAGGDPDESEGTIEWAGGEIDYDNCPYTMYVKSVRATDATNGTVYEYGDQTGDYTSIKTLEYANSTTLEDWTSGNTNSSGNSTSTSTSNSSSIASSVSSSAASSSASSNSTSSDSDSAASKWDGLSKTAKYSIIGGTVGAAALGVSILSFCCIRQRSAGRKEREAADKEYEKQTSDLLQYRAEMNRQRSAGDQMEMTPMMQTPGQGGVRGQMKRLSQSMGFKGQPKAGGYQGDYQRF